MIFPDLQCPEKGMGECSSDNHCSSRKSDPYGESQENGPKAKKPVSELGNVGVRRPWPRGKARGKAKPKVLSAGILLGHSVEQGKIQRNFYLGRSSSLEHLSKLGTLSLKKGLWKMIHFAHIAFASLQSNFFPFNFPGMLRMGKKLASPFQI